MSPFVCGPLLEQLPNTNRPSCKQGREAGRLALRTEMRWSQLLVPFSPVPAGTVSEDCGSPWDQLCHFRRKGDPRETKDFLPSVRSPAGEGLWGSDGPWPAAWCSRWGHCPQSSVSQLLSRILPGCILRLVKRLLKAGHMRKMPSGSDINLP